MSEKKIIKINQDLFTKYPSRNSDCRNVKFACHGIKN